MFGRFQELQSLPEDIQPEDLPKRVDDFLPPKGLDCLTELVSSIEMFENALEWGDQRPKLETYLQSLSKAIQTYACNIHETSSQVLVEYIETMLRDGTLSGHYKLLEARINKEEPPDQRDLSVVRRIKDKFDPHTPPQQDIGDIPTLMLEARKSKPVFDQLMEAVVTATRAKRPAAEVVLELGGLKHFYRIVEKVTLGRSKAEMGQEDTTIRGSHVLDVVRCAIVCDSIATITTCLEVLESMAEGNRFEIVRLKDRLSEPTNAGWMDLMVNIRIENR